MKYFPHCITRPTKRLTSYKHRIPSEIHTHTALHHTNTQHTGLEIFWLFEMIDIAPRFAAAGDSGDAGVSLFDVSVGCHETCAF